MCCTGNRREPLRGSTCSLLNLCPLDEKICGKFVTFRSIIAVWTHSPPETTIICMYDHCSISEILCAKWPEMATDPEREQALLDYKKKLLEHKEVWK